VAQPGHHEIAVRHHRSRGSTQAPGDHLIRQTETNSKHASNNTGSSTTVLPPLALASPDEDRREPATEPHLARGQSIGRPKALDVRDQVPVPIRPMRQGHRPPCAPRRSPCRCLPGATAARFRSAGLVAAAYSEGSRRSSVGAMVSAASSLRPGCVALLRSKLRVDVPGKGRTRKKFVPIRRHAV
jgi:hypothetical protein